MESQHTREMDKNRDSDKNKDNARRGSESVASTGSDGMTGNRTSQNSGAGEGTMEQAKTIAATSASRPGTSPIPPAPPRRTWPARPAT